MTKALKKNWLSVALFVLFLIPAAYAQRLNVTNVANEITPGVGTVGKTATGETGQVFVFEEFHTSRVGQLQIAVMLLRLHDRYGVNKVGLEGMLQRSHPLDGSWFHNAGGYDARSAREDVAVRMLAEGEISAPELMTLVFPDMQVYGTEIKDQYEVKLGGEGTAEIRYLLAIAERLLTQADILKYNDLVQQKKYKEALEYMLTRDPWVGQKSEELKNPPVGESLMHMIARIREIQNKARELGVKVETKIEQEMENTLQFFETASKRSETMVNYVLRLLGMEPERPVAVIIGAAHTQEVIELFQSRNVSFAQITPLALDPNYAQLSDEQFDRKNEGKWARTGLGTLGALLNGSRKPPPIIENATSYSYASMGLAAILVAQAARAGTPIPDGVWAQIASLPELRVDRDSFAVDGYDVVFRAWLKGTDGGDKEVWARVGSLDTPEKAKTLEEKLLQAISDLGGGGKLPPRDPPPGSERAENEGPADGKRGDFLISRLGREVALFAASRDALMKVKVSG